MPTTDELIQEYLRKQKERESGLLEAGERAISDVDQFMPQEQVIQPPLAPPEPASDEILQTREVGEEPDPQDQQEIVAPPVVPPVTPPVVPPVVPPVKPPVTPPVTAPEAPEDEEMAKARFIDMMIPLLGSADKALALWDASAASRTTGTKMAPVLGEKRTSNRMQDLLKKREKESAEVAAKGKEKRGLEMDKLKKAHLVAQTKKLTGELGKLAGQAGSDDPTSEASRNAQRITKEAGFEGDLSGWSADKILRNEKNLTRKFTMPLSREKETRMSEKQAWQMAEKDEVSDKQLASVTELDNMSDMLGRIKELKGSVNTGVYSQKAHEVGKYYPFDVQDKDQAALTALTGTVLADYIKSISGAAVSEQEAERLNRNIPEMTDDDKIFNRKLNELEKTLADTMNNRLVNMEKYQTKDLPERVQKMVYDKFGKAKKSDKPQKLNVSDKKEGDTWEDETYKYRMNNGKVQRARK